MSEMSTTVNLDETNFATQVLEQSQRLPVLVDFWAEWCGPCKMLAPVLEKLALAYQGKAVVAKLDIDRHPDLATRYQVRSVPTLKLFRHGQVVEEVVGAQPEGVLRQVLERYIERPADRQCQQAAVLHAQGLSEEALAVLRQALQTEPDYFPLHRQRLEILLELGRYRQAHEVIKQLPANLQAEAGVQEMLSRLDFGLVCEDAPPPAELEQTLATAPDAHLARYQLSAAQVLRGEYAPALDNLLYIMRKDRRFQDDAAYKAILAVFKILGQDPLVGRYRGKLSALLY